MPEEVAQQGSCHFRVALFLCSTQSRLPRPQQDLWASRPVRPVVQQAWTSYAGVASPGPWRLAARICCAFESEGPFGRSSRPGWSRKWRRWRGSWKPILRGISCRCWSTLASRLSVKICSRGRATLCNGDEDGRPDKLQKQLE